MDHVFKPVRTRLCLAAAVSALTMTAAPSAAQNAPPVAPAANEDPVPLEEVTITAQRVQESAQKAPIAVTVVRPEDLIRENVTRAEDLSRVVPALLPTASGGPNTSFFLRGVGNSTANSYSDPAIAFDYDGVYIGRPNATQGLLFDLERIEVLKGPQGTLYGRNATGGAINVLPVRPQLRDLSAEVLASYGNYDAKQLQAFINAPLGDHVAFRLSATFDKHRGYLSDGTDDQDQRAVRAQILAKITPELTTRFAADYSHQGGAGTGSFIYGTSTFVNPSVGYGFTSTPDLGSRVGVHDPRSSAFLQTLFISQAGRFSEPLDSYPSQDDATWGVTNETNWELGAGTLTVQTAWRRADIDSLSTTANFRAFYIDEKSDQKSLEARFAGKAGHFVDYLVGGYWFDEDIDSAQAINQLATYPFQRYDTGTRSRAGFGKLAFHVTDTLTLTAAGRYTHDVKRMDGTSTVYSLFCGAPGPVQNFCPTVPLMPLTSNPSDVVAFYGARGIPFAPPGAAGPNMPTVFVTQLPNDTTLTTNKPTYRLAADLQATPSNLLYVSYETGFHSGGFSFGRGLETYAPETIAALTAGSKNRFFDDRVQINVEAFRWKYKDQQFSQFGTDFSMPPVFVFYTSNIGRSTIRGVDLDFDARVTSSTRIGGGVQFLDSTYTANTVYTVAAFGAPSFNCPYAPVVYQATPSYAVDCSGKPGLYSPRWSANVGIEQTFDVDGYTLVARAGTRYRSDFYAATTYEPWVISRAAFESDASLTLEPPSGRWFATAYVNNIENERRITQSNYNSSLSTLSAVASAPRLFGVRVGARF